jgi:hypothetical protein
MLTRDKLMKALKQTNEKAKFVTRSRLHHLPRDRGPRRAKSIARGGRIRCRWRHARGARRVKNFEGIETGLFRYDVVPAAQAVQERRGLERAASNFARGKARCCPQKLARAC